MAMLRVAALGGRDARASVFKCREEGLDQVAVPFNEDDNGYGFSAQDLKPQAWANRVLAWLDGDFSAAAFSKAAGMAEHLELLSIIVPNADIAGFGERCWSILEANTELELWVRVKASEWRDWNGLRTVCDLHSRLKVLVELDVVPEAEDAQRWVAEPVAGFVIRESSWRGLRLDSRVCALIEQWAVLGDLTLFVDELDGAKAQVLEQVWDTRLNHATEIEQFCEGFHGVLLPPLQPLGDHLSSATYDIFEVDPWKYRAYEEAIYYALKDRGPEPQVLMVVGAGRGPLVDAAIRASESSGIAVRVYALDKNPYAAMTLRHRRATEWGDRVTVVESDMRTWDAPEQADILVSELLGSFGDNELSPECLDGAQRFLRSDGISIPISYTSYLAPVHAPLLFGKIPLSTPGCESTSVALMDRALRLARPQACFHFEHPHPELSDDNSHNARQVALDFTLEHTGMLHGFAGYFDSRLYGDVYLSTHPERPSPGMYAWFPLYIPIRQARLFNAGDVIGVRMIRRATPQQVWYSWNMTKPELGVLHNPLGRSDAIRLW